MDIDIAKLLALPPAERVRLARILWDSIAENADVHTVPMSDDERAQLEQRLEEYPEDDAAGRPVDEVLAELRRKICQDA